MLLLLASNLAGLMHSVTVRHATCLEHGESIHVPDSARGVDAAAVASSDCAAVSDAGTDAGGDEHDHCCAWASSRERACLSEHGGRAAADHAATAQAGAPAIHAPTLSKLYRLAPKSSPPSASV